MANGITLKADSGPYIVTTAPANFFTASNLTGAVTAPVLITADTVWYCSAAVAAAVPDVTIVATQLDGTTIFSGTIRVGETTDTYLRPAPTLAALASDNGFQVIKYKTADELVNNSTTLQDDDHLTFLVPASSKWAVRYYLFTNAPSATADYKFTVAAPSGATGLWGGLAATGSTSTGSAGTVFTNATDPGTSQAYAAFGATNTLSLQAYIAVSTTAGSITLQWAQNTQTVEDTKLKAGSFLVANRLA